MRLVLLAGLALGAWLFLRARRAEPAPRVLVGWDDGSELELRVETPARERLQEIAEGVLR